MATVAELRGEIRQFAERLLAKHGLVANTPGVALFTLIEDVGRELGDTLAQEVIRHQAVQQTSSPVHCCPQCGEPGLRKNESSRTVATCRGPVEIPEIECYCKRCRKSFFPSLGESGAGGGLRLQSGTVGEDGLRRSEREQL